MPEVTSGSMTRPACRWCLSEVNRVFSKHYPGLWPRWWGFPTHNHVYAILGNYAALLHLSESSWNSSKLLQIWLLWSHGHSHMLPHALPSCWAPRVFSPSLPLSRIGATALSTLWSSMLLDFPQTHWEGLLLLPHRVQSSDINFIRHF